MSDKMHERLVQALTSTTIVMSQDPHTQTFSLRPPSEVAHGVWSPSAVRAAASWRRVRGLG